MKEFKKFAKFLADSSGKIIKEYFRKPLSIENKIDDSPVTIADKKAEELLRTLIMKEYPDHGIKGEEFGIYNDNAEYKWILDPIDGTISFICGAFSFGTLIALTKNSEPVLGVINQPVLNEFLIGDNSTAELNGSPVKVRECENISEAILLTTDHNNVHKYQNGKNFDEFIKKVKLYRNWGDCYGYYLLATGYADIMIDPVLHEWDLMALIPIIGGAGGIITDYQGKNAAKGNSAIAASKKIHSETVKFLNR